MSLCRSREGDDPDRRGPPVSGRERKGEAERAAREEWAGRASWAGVEKKKKGRGREREVLGRTGNKG